MSETDFIGDVQRYDPSASEETVGKIVKHLGIALQTRDDGTLTDSGLVSASDKTELDRVREKWCVGKLGLDEGTANQIIGTVAEEMASDRRKKRVTFYYLAAKHAGKLETL